MTHDLLSGLLQPHLGSSETETRGASSKLQGTCEGSGGLDKLTAASSVLLAVAAAVHLGGAVQ